MRSAAIHCRQDVQPAFSRELQRKQSARSLCDPIAFAVRSIALVLAFILPSAAAFAQLPSETDVTSTPTPNAGHDYIHSLVETVNPANGSLSIRIGVPMPPSRGFTVPFNFAYDSNGAFYLHSPCVGCDGFEWWTTNSMLSQGGWSYSVPMLSVETSSFVMQTISPTDVPGTFTCQARTDFVMQDVAGDRHNLGISYFNPNPACTTGGPDSQVPIATVGQYLTQTTPRWAGTANNDPGATYPLTVTDGDGMVYSFPQAGAPPTAYHCATCRPITYPPRLITDRYGNAFGINYAASGLPSSPGLTYTDTVGRQALSIPTFGASPDSITVSGLSQPYRVSWESVQASFPITMSQLPGSDPSCSSLSPRSQPPINVISSIVLPDGQGFTFDYDPVYGLINKITYPSGGYVSYVWGVNPQSEYGLWQKTLSNGSAGFCAYHYDTPAIQKRFVSFDGTTIALEQDFDLTSSPYTTTWDTNTGYWDQKTTTVVTKDLLRDTQYSTKYTYGWTGADEQPNTSIGMTTQIPVEQAVQYQGTNGLVLKTVGKHWYNERLIAQQTTTLPGNLVSESDWTYNQNEMMTERDDYDFGRGARGSLLRKTIVPAYQTFSQSNASVHIVDKPNQVKLLDGTGTVVGGVGYTYCGSPNSDGSCPPPGNLISRSDWVTGDGGTTVTTSHTYDGYGNIISTKDPAGDVTTFTYGGLDSCGFSSPAAAYLTNIAYPTVSGVSLQKSFTYNCGSGSLASATDENGRVTSYQYSDPLGRLTETDGPPDPNNGGSHPTTQVCYNDGSPNPTVTTSVLMNAQTGPASCYGTTGTWKTTVNEMDGLGHTIWNETTSGPQGTIYVKTTYDGDGNVWTTSNPSYSPTSLTNTTFEYDSLGRKTRETFADSTAQNPDYKQWCYDGIASQGQTNCLANKATETNPANLANYPWTDQSDENGNHSQQISDGLGRLAAVMEPNASDIPALETDYGYDALGNLVKVDQWGGAYGSPGDRQREFVYDGLSRLTTSYNPESGVTGYAYLASGANCSGDAGLPCTKTDARGVTTHYQYDALNRLTGKYYTGDPNGTPASCYQYGSSSSQNTVGRLTAEYTQKYTSVDCSAAPTGGYLTLRSILSYDTAGHLTEEQQCSPGGCVAGGPYDLAYKYDLAGDLTYSTNGISSTPGAPSGPLAFTETYDAAGNLASVGSNWGDATHPACLFVAQVQAGATATCTQVVANPYEAFGAIWNAEYGTGIVITKSYDPRMRFSGESDIGTLIQSATPATATITISGAEQSLQSQQ